MKLFNPLMIAANLLGGSVGLYAVICIACLAVIAILIFAKTKITYIDPETDEVISVEKFSWLSKATIPEAEKENKRFLGWSLNTRGTAPVGKQAIRMTKSLTLYAVWDENYGTLCEFDANAIVEVVFNDKDGEEITVESHPIKVELPDIDDGVIGWSLAPGAAPVFDKDPDSNAVVTVKLYPVYADAENVSEEVVEEIVEEPVEEIAEEVVEEAAEEIVEETVEEAEPEMAEEVAEEPAPEVEEALEAEEAIEQEPELFEEVIEEPIEEPAEEIAEEPEEVVEEVAEVVEETVEETVEEAVEEAVEEEPEIAQEAPVEEAPVDEEPEAEAPVEEIVEEEAEEVFQEPEVQEAEEIAEAVEEEPAPVAEEAPEAEGDKEDEIEITPTIVPSYYDSLGNEINIKYSRSITANIIQAEDSVKDFYSAIKNHILSYKGVKSRFSWKFDSFNKGRDQLFKLKIRGKTICLYCALNPYEFDKTKYHHEAIDAKIFEAVPMLVKIKSQLGLKKAKELVDIEMAKFGIEKDPKFKEVNYVEKYPYEETEELVQKKLVKVLVADVNMVKAAKPETENVEEPVEEIVPEVVEEPVIEEIAEEAEPEVAEEPVIEEVAEEAEPEVAEEPVIEEVAEEAEPEVAEEPVIEEVIEETPDEDHEELVLEIHEPAKTVEEIHYVESVTADEVDDLVVDEVVESMVEEDVEYITEKDTKKAIVNIDTLSKSYENGDIVDLASLKAKKLIDKRAKTVKVLARGMMDKQLTVKAGEFSDTALKMIILTGGHAVHVSYRVK